MSLLQKTITRLCQLSILAIFVISNATVSLAQDDPAFTDIYPGHPSYLPIKTLKDTSVLTGYEDGSFQPDKEVNRAEALTVIMRAFSQPTSTPTDPEATNQEDLTDFPDIQTDSWYYESVSKALNDKIVTGYDDGTFKPENPVTLAEALAMSLRTINEMPSPPSTEEPTTTVDPPFTDISEYAWYLPEFQWAKDKEILDISRGNKVYPDEPLTREELAQLIFRIMQSSLDYKFGGASYYSDFFEGRGTSSGEPFTQSALTAANQTLPFGTIVEVTNLQNGKSVQVKINDRGPWGHPGRKLDLSRSAFEAIGNTSSGHITVEYKVIE